MWIHFRSPPNGSTSELNIQPWRHSLWTTHTICRNDLTGTQPISRFVSCIQTSWPLAQSPCCQGGDSTYLLRQLLGVCHSRQHGPSRHHIPIGAPNPGPTMVSCGLLMSELPTSLCQDSRRCAIGCQDGDNTYLVWHLFQIFYMQTRGPNRQNFPIAGGDSGPAYSFMLKRLADFNCMYTLFYSPTPTRLWIFYAGGDVLIHRAQHRVKVPQACTTESPSPLVWNLRRDSHPFDSKWICTNRTCSFLSRRRW